MFFKSNFWFGFSGCTRFSRYRLMKTLGGAVFFLLGAVPANGSEAFPRYGNELDCGHCRVMEIDRLAALLGDEVLRDMVCRLSHQRFAFGNLSSALGVPEGQVMRRINTLRGWGLVRTVTGDSAHTIVEPVPGDGARTLRRWADKYCSAGAACGRPVASAESARDRRETLGPGGVIASPVSDEAGVRGKLVTVFGGSGFIGRHLVERLVDAGARVRVAVRDPDFGRYLSRMGVPRQAELMAANVDDEAQVRKAVAGATMVVNLVGILNKPGGQKYAAVNLDGARRIAEAAAAAKVARLVHVSSMSADPNSTSLYAQTKAAGEVAARAAFPSLTIVRPSVVFGPEDDIFSRFANLSRYSPVLPLFGGGKTIVQPVYVGDVGAAIVRILANPETRGLTYELGGPRTMSMREIVSMVAKETGRRRLLVPVPIWAAEIQAEILQSLPNPPLTREEVALLRSDIVVDPKALGLADLGITPTPVEDVAPEYLAPQRRDAKSEPAY